MEIKPRRPCRINLAVRLPEQQRAENEKSETARNDRSVCRPPDAEFGRAPVSVNERVVQRDVAADHDEVHDHDRERQSASAPECADGSDDQRNPCENRKKFEIGDFLFKNRVGMSELFHQPRSPEPAGRHEETADDGNQNRLPDGESHALALPRPGVLCDKRVHISDRSHEEAGDCEVGQSGRHGGRNRFRRVASEHHAVAEKIQRMSRRGHNQRKRNFEHMRHSAGFPRIKRYAWNIHKQYP